MLNYLRQLLQLVFAISVMYTLLDCNAKLKKNRYWVGIIIAVVFIFDVIALYKLGYTAFMKHYYLFVHLPVFLVFMFISSFKPIKVFFVHWTLVAITASFTSVAVIISYFFNFSNTLVNLIVYIMQLPTWIVIYRYIRPSFLYVMRHTDKGWFAFCMIPLTYSVLIYSISSYNMTSQYSGSTVKSAALLFVLAFSSYYMILRYFKQTREQLTLQNEQDLLKTQISAARTHLDALQESQEKTILYRHDMRHHLSLISAYLADDNKTAAQKYIAEVGSAINGTVIPKYCANYAVNLILYSYITRAENNHITMETQLDLAENNAISDMDLCVIFANAIENATNACSKLMNAECRRVNILCKNKDGKLLIQITNPYAGEVIFDSGRPVRTMENHGLGVKSMAAVAEKYGGLYSFTAEDGLFCASIIL